ncbi:PQQ-binding-like beta-propeller repeat protein [bacterium]|nr:PQQ-binding-like beta-propeller repeat protein [bacterium]
MTYVIRRLLGTMILATLAVTTLATAQHQDRWPQFRGEGSKGISAEQDLPMQWDGESMANIAWKVRIPGLGLSSPTIWDGKVFVTSAVTHIDEPFLRVGLYGESPDHPEDYDHKYTVYCLDATTGKIIWERIAITAVPKVKRHIKSSHANCSVALDGKHVVAFFGSQGLYCYDMDGNLRWSKDLGYLDAGAFNSPTIQWGFASSPILFNNTVYTLCDVNNQSFIAAYNADTGEQVWRTDREEVPTWGSPIIIHVDGKPQIVVNGWHRRAAYDAITGEEIWFMDGGGDIPTPTPFEAHGHIYFSSAHGRQRPLYAIKKTAKGDISLKGRATSNEYITWANLRRGAYQSTPLVYDDLLYVVQGSGALTTFNALTGEQIYRELSGGERGAYTASLVASDSRIYVNNEFGKVHVIQAGKEYKHLATNIMGDELMATPSIAGKTLYIRTRRYLWAVRNQGDKVIVHTVKKTEPKVLPVKPFTPPKSKQTDAKEILRISGLACEAIPTPQYKINLYGTGALESRMGNVTFTNSTIGNVMRFQGEGSSPGNPEVNSFYVGFNGNSFYAVDHEAKKLHVNFESNVMGEWAGLRRFGNLGKFGIENGFNSEINNSKLIELRGIVNIEGTECYEIYVDYPGEGSRPDIWFISTKDFLPKKYIELYTMPDGSTGEMIKVLLKVVPEPTYEKGFFDIPTLDGYTTTKEALAQ